MIEGDERDLFRRTLKSATESSTGGELDRALADLGWAEALAVDRQTAASLLFELQGRANATSSALGLIMSTVAGVEAPDGARFLLPPLGSTNPPGQRAGHDLHVGGLALSGAATDDYLVACSDGVVSLTSATITKRRIEGIDPRLGFVDVSAAGVQAPVISPLEKRSWSEAVAVGQIALAHELVGASDAMLELAREHALERIQFGQPIARFQAVRHRLAEACVALESARSVAEAAWIEATPFAATLAKSVAGRNAKLVAKHAQQVLAGIGFTAEHDLHKYVRRVLVLDALLGDSKTLTARMGEDLLETRSLERVFAL